METTFNSILKHNALLAVALSVVIYLQTGTSGDIQNLRDDIQALRIEMAEGHQAIRTEMVKGDQAIRAGTNAGFQAIRAEMAESDRAIRADMSEEFGAVRADMSEEFGAVRADMSEEFRAVRADISVLGERIARVETRLTSIERVFYADLEPPAP